MNVEQLEVTQLDVERTSILEAAALLGAITALSAFESNSINPLEIIQHMSYFFSS